MLGQLYRPRGLALETAQAVLEVQEPFACNVALGCSNACLYCYVSKATHQPKEVCKTVRLPQKPPVELVKHQLERYYKFHWGVQGVFLSFLTDPFLPQVKHSTRTLIAMLMYDHAIRVATLSKLATSHFSGVRQGMTIVSLSDKFWKRYEPNTTHPQARLQLLRTAKENCDYVWISMEPFPTSAIYPQKLENLLEEMKFVDFILFGKWNYDKRANDMQAKEEYRQIVPQFVDWCKSNNIRYLVKSETLQFIK